MFRILFDNPIVCKDMEEIDAMLSEKNLLYGQSIYISGASGMIASYITAYLIWLNERYSADIQIFVGVRSKEKAKNRFGAYAQKEYFHILEQDVNLPIICAQHFDYMIHAASLASPQYYGCNPVETMLPNVIGTNTLLIRARHDGVKGFLFFSSGSVYGTIDNGGIIKEENRGLFDFLHRGNVYGESKRCGEALCTAYYNEYQVPVKIARIYHTYGPTADIENDTRVFSEFVKSILHNNSIIIRSTGEDRRSFCYISDAAVGLLKILLSGEKGEVYNMGNPYTFVSINELANLLVETFPEYHLQIIREKRNDKGYNASPEKRIASVSTEKLEHLGWKPSVSIQEGFLRMIRGIEYDGT